MIATSEYELVTEAVGAADRSDRAKFLVRGSEAADFLQGQVSNDVEALEPGTGCYATILNVKGKLRTDLRVLRGKDIGAHPAEPGASADWFFLDTEAIGHAVLRHMLETYSLGRDVQHEDLTTTRALVSLLGPGARAALDVEPPEEEHAFVEGEHGLYVSTDLGVDVIGEPGLDLGVPAVSQEVAECVRIESGRPRLGYDMDAETMPAGGRHQRARGQLHQGLLRRPGDRRAAALQGPTQSPPARAAAARAGRARHRHPARRQGRRPRRVDLCLAAARADRARARPPRGRAGRQRERERSDRGAGRVTVHAWLSAARPRAEAA